MITTAGSAMEVLKESISLLSLRQYGVLMQALCKQIPSAGNTKRAAKGGGAVSSVGVVVREVSYLNG